MINQEVISLLKEEVNTKKKKWAQSCPTLCDPVDCSLQGSSVHGIFQARVLEWVAISFSRGSSRPRDRTCVAHTSCIEFSSVHSLSRVRVFATPWTVACQAPPSMGFPRQKCWSGLPFHSPGDLPNPGIEPGSRVLQADALSSEPPGKPN